MSKLISLKDIVQISPEKSLTDLTKTAKHQLMDSMLCAPSTDAKRGLEVTFNLSSSGRRINNRIYTPTGQRAGIDSWTVPYGKPIIKDHDTSTADNVIGRIIEANWISSDSDAVKFFRRAADYMTFKDAMESNRPKLIYRALRDNHLLTNSRWMGTGQIVAKAKIFDEDAIEKFLDGRYLTFSAGTRTDRYVCGICGDDWAAGEMCEHRPGVITEDGDIPVFITGMFIGDEASVLSQPASQLAMVQSMRMADGMVGPRCTPEDLLTDPSTIYITDGAFDIPALPVKTEDAPVAEEIVVEDNTDREIDFSVPAGVKAELKKGLDWHEEGKSGDGMKPETVAWARRMAGGDDISPEKAVKMRAWLARHEVDKKGEGFKPGEPGFPSPGRVAWALWGGDPAVAWSNKLVRQIEAEKADDAEVVTETEVIAQDVEENIEVTDEMIADIVARVVSALDARGNTAETEVVVEDVEVATETAIEDAEVIAEDAKAVAEVVAEDAAEAVVEVAVEDNTEVTELVDTATEEVLVDEEAKVEAADAEVEETPVVEDAHTPEHGEEEPEGEEYDHEIEIPQGNMQELHETGVTDVVVAQSGKTMTIRVRYNNPNNDGEVEASDEAEVVESAEETVATEDTQEDAAVETAELTDAVETTEVSTDEEVVAEVSCDDAEENVEIVEEIEVEATEAHTDSEEKTVAVEEVAEMVDSDASKDYVHALKTIESLKAELAELKSDDSLDTQTDTIQNEDSSLLDSTEPTVLTADAVEAIENPGVSSSETIRDSNKNLDKYTQGVVDNYLKLKDERGEVAASYYIQRKIAAGYLPRKFDITKYSGE